MEKVVQTVIKKLARGLGGQLEAVFLFGSLAQGQHQPGESDINLIAIVNDGTSVQDIRNIFLPIWQEYGDILLRAPLIAKETDFSRYLSIAPTFAHHLIHEGQILLGPPDYLDGWPATDPFAAAAYLAWEAMRLSSTVSPQLLEPKQAEEQLVQLRRLARRLHGKPLSQEKSAVELFALVQYHLEQKVTALIGSVTPPEPPTTTTDFLPGLQSIYQYSTQTMLVFQDLTPHQIREIQWQTLAERIADRSKGLLIATAAQLCLITELERPLDLVFMRYQHEWGEDPLAELNLSKRQVLRHAARLPSLVQIDSLPNAYLTLDDSKLRDIIHDFQNKLLNVQLEHELLCRLENIEHFTPPEPLPDRTAPAHVRIDAIFNHLGWWAEYYTNEMMKHD